LIKKGKKNLFIKFKIFIFAEKLEFRIKRKWEMGNNINVYEKFLKLIIYLN